MKLSMFKDFKSRFDINKSLKKCKNMLKIIEKDKCCGCSACFSACGHQAITMQLDSEGFEYPIISQEACVDCGLCQSVCPVLQYENRKNIREKNSDEQIGFVARNRNYSQRLASSSGSIFPPIAEWILDNDGLVVGAAYDNDFNVIHKIVESKDELCLLQGSKYLQCKADNKTFKNIRNELKTGRKVLYSGMACQVEGLKSFLKKDYDNLYTIDLICMGIPSYVVWQKYLAAFFEDEKIISINFKEKSIGWDTFTFRVDTDKRIFKERGTHNLYLRSMFLSWNMRPSCFQCPFKNVKRISDFTLADAWGVSHSTPEINDNKGLSSVVVHSKKGLELWNILKHKIDSVQVSIDDIAAGNSNLITNKPQTGNRQLFFETLNVNSKEAFLKLCSIRKASLKGRLKNKFVFFLTRIYYNLFK